ncbi:MAG: CaiB/BaiF CoA transferase family protein [bacterium]
MMNQPELESDFPKPRGPLQGVRVLELAHIMAGPVCGLMLADLGADVIKVEKMPGGDDTRRMIPPMVGEESAAFMMMNRNKRGIAVNLKQEQGKEILRKLVAEADVLIENYRHDTMKKLGLGYDELKQINPGLVYCEISGFGRSGPFMEQGGFDLIAQGMSGLMSITGEEPGRSPVKVGAPLTDITAGILGALGAVSALHQRNASGQGQKVDTSLFEAGIVHTYWQSAICMATGVSPGPMGSAHPLNAPYQTFRTRDGWINVGAANQRNWERLLEVLGVPEMGSDPRFEDNHGRMDNLKPLEEELNKVFETRTTKEWLERLAEVGVPSGPVLDIQEMHRHPQTQARQMVTEVNHPIEGKVETIGLPIKLSETPGGVQRPSPLYGEHTREVLLESGYDEDKVSSFENSGSIFCHDG